MNEFVLTSVDYITKNFAEIRTSLIDIVIIVYFLYGFILAADASKRYRNSLTPVLVFFGWVLGSLIFLPIYLTIRPEIGAKDRVDIQTQKEALLLGSGLDSCPHCGNVVERFYQYCRNCGEPVTKHCSECGETLAFHWTHCIKCGKLQPNVEIKQKPDKLKQLMQPALNKINPPAAAPPQTPVQVAVTQIVPSEQEIKPEIAKLDDAIASVSKMMTAEPVKIAETPVVTHQVPNSTPVIEPPTIATEI